MLNRMNGWSRKHLFAVGLWLAAASWANAQTETKEVWACVTEHMVGIATKSDGKTYTGNFKPEPEKFLLTVHAFGSHRTVSISPDFVLGMQEQTGYPLTEYTFKQHLGFGWLIFREQVGTGARLFRLGYVDGGQYVMTGRCLLF